MAGVNLTVSNLADSEILCEDGCAEPLTPSRQSRRSWSPSRLRGSPGKSSPGASSRQSRHTSPDRPRFRDVRNIDDSLKCVFRERDAAEEDLRRLQAECRKLDKEVVAAANRHTTRSSCADSDSLRWRSVLWTSTADMGQFGVGIQLYFELVKNLGMAFAVMALFAFPLFAANISGTMLPSGVVFSFAQTTIGNLGTRPNFPVGTPAEVIQDALHNRNVTLFGEAVPIKRVTTMCGWLDAFAVAMLVAFGVWHRFVHMGRTVQLHDEAHITPSDYAIVVTNIPQWPAGCQAGCRQCKRNSELRRGGLKRVDVTLEGELKRHFQDVVSSWKSGSGVGNDAEQAAPEVPANVYSARSDSQLDAQRYAPEVPQQETIREIQVAYARGGAVLAAMQKLTVKRKLKALQVRQRKGEKVNEKKLAHLESSHDALAQRVGTELPRGRACAAFVVFEDPQDRDAVLTAYGQSVYPVLKWHAHAELAFHGVHLEVTRAPEPSSILWENLEYPELWRFLRKSFTFIVTVVLLVLAGTILYASEASPLKIVDGVEDVGDTFARIHLEVPCGYACDVKFFEDEACAREVSASPLIRGACEGVSWNSTSFGCIANPSLEGLQAAFPSSQVVRCVSVFVPDCLGDRTCEAKVSMIQCDATATTCVELVVSAATELELDSQAGVNGTRVVLIPQKQSDACVEPVNLEEALRWRALGHHERVMCFCKQQSRVQLSSEEVMDICSPYVSNLMSSSARVVLGAIVVVIVNALLDSSLHRLARWERPPSISALHTSIMYKLFFLEFLNTGLLTLLVHANFGWSFAGEGDQTDFDAEWYVKVGAGTVLTMLLNAISPHLVAVVTDIFRRVMRRWRWQKVATEEDLRSMFTNPDFMLSARFAQLLNTVFVTLMYSAAMPLILMFAVVNFLVVFWVDKFLLLRSSRLPPSFDHTIADSAVAMLPLAALLHTAFAIWMYGHPLVFPSESIDGESGWSLYIEWYDTFEQSSGMALEQTIRQRMATSATILLSLLFVAIWLALTVNAAVQAFGTTLEKVEGVVTAAGGDKWEMCTSKCFAMLRRCCLSSYRAGSRAAKTVGTFTHNEHQMLSSKLLTTYDPRANPDYRDVWREMTGKGQEDSEPPEARIVQQVQPSGREQGEPLHTIVLPDIRGFGDVVVEFRPQGRRQ